MSKKSPEEALKKLLKEHANSRYSDPETEARANQLISDIKRQIEHPDSVAAQTALQQRIEAEITGFEVEHPQLTAAFMQIVAAFSNMGI